MLFAKLLVPFPNQILFCQQVVRLQLIVFIAISG